MVIVTMGCGGTSRNIKILNKNVQDLSVEQQKFIEEQSKFNKEFQKRLTKSEKLNKVTTNIWKTAIASMERLLLGGIRAGFLTPSQAFGSRFIECIEDCDLAIGAVGSENCPRL